MSVANMEPFSENGVKETYNELVSQDDFNADSHPLYHSGDSSKVSMFTVKDGPSSQRYRLATVGLGLLSAVFLAAIIALSIIYSGVSDRHDRLYFNSTRIIFELQQLQDKYEKTTRAKNVLQSQLDRQNSRTDHLQSQINTLGGEKTELQSRITQLEGSCGLCLPGWELLNSTCYYFAIANSISRQGWARSRDDCIKKGANLVAIDSQEKQEFIFKTIKAYRYNSGNLYTNGFWIGLKEDGHAAGTWKWPNGNELTRGYWMDGEPNDYIGKEDCAATYPTFNAMKTWNDAPCLHPLKWICEMQIKAP